MSDSTPDAVLQRIVTAAVDATGAGAGWIVGRDDGGLHVVAVAGIEPEKALGQRIGGPAGAAAHVIESGQPIALFAGTPDSRLGEGIPALLGRRPSSLLSVPCTTESMSAGALELIDKEGEAGFSFDDVEISMVLGTIAGAALAAGSTSRSSVSSPAELFAKLEQFAAADPAGYREVALVINKLLSSV